MRPYSDTLFDRYTLRAIWRGNADSFRKSLCADLLGWTPGNLGGTPGWKIKVITRTCLKKGRNQFQTLGYVKKVGPVRVEQFNGECARFLTLELVTRASLRGPPLSAVGHAALVCSRHGRSSDRHQRKCSSGREGESTPHRPAPAWAPCGLCTLCE